MKVEFILPAVVALMFFGACNQPEKKAEVAATETTTVAEQPKKAKSVVVARVKVQEGKAEDFLKIALPLVEAANQEEGNLYYELYRSPRNPNTFIFYEEYVDDSAFTVHANSEHFKKFAAALPEVIDGDLVVDRY
jgi:quinol monooxygenase YgiN